MKKNCMGFKIQKDLRIGFLALLLTSSLEDSELNISKKNHKVNPFINNIIFPNLYRNQQGALIGPI